MACLPGYAATMVMRDGNGAMRKQRRGYPRPQRRRDGDRVQAQRDQEQRVALQPHPGAIVMIRRGLPPAAARALLQECQGSLQAALGE
jgi:hypothetical protein